jgi:hypothetical protein
MGPKGPWTVLYWANAFGPVFKMQFMDSFAIVLTDHESIMRVTRKTSEPGSHAVQVSALQAFVETLSWRTASLLGAQPETDSVGLHFAHNRLY